MVSCHEKGFLFHILTKLKCFSMVLLQENQLLYPMNALVEDQMVRLRKMLDSPEALNILDQRANGNRIFFGRYTSASPVPGYLVHPRRSDQQEKTRAKSRLDRTKVALRTIAEDQEKAPTRQASAQGWGEDLVGRGLCE